MDDNIVVIIEDTQTKLQALLSTMVNDRIKRDIIGNEAKQIITNCIKRLNDLGCERDFVEKQRQAFMTTFLNWYMRITANLAKLAQKTKNPTFYQSYTEIVGVEPKTSGKSMIINLGQNDLRAGEKNNSQNIEVGGIKNIRDYFTTGETGYSQMFIEDYQKRVNQEIMRIASQNVVLVNRKGRAISARNLAEMQVRFEEQVKDMERLKEKGAKFVVATSHANASTRCQPWQGKIYILDAEVGSVAIKDNHYDGEPKPIGKTPDGKDYYSLREAMTHGFLGYNCRHRLILYKPGMIMPKEYTANQVSKERSIETTARSLERQIRVAKKRALLSSDKEERKKFREKSKKIQDVYWQYCKEHDYPVAEWRTRVAINEREGLKSGNISFESNDNNQGNRYVPSSLMNGDSKTEQEEEIVIPKEAEINPFVKSEEYKNILKSHFKDKKVAQAVAKGARKIFGTGKAKRVEGVCIIDKDDLKKDFYNANGKSYETVLGIKGQKYISKVKNGILIHNHRGNTPPSYADLMACYRRSKMFNQNMEYLILTNDGKIYYYKNVDVISERVYNKYVGNESPKSMEKGMFELAKEHGFVFERWN